MTEPFIGEIRTIGFNFAPKGWALCNGQILPITQNTALFSLLGDAYGGNGQTTFALPNLNGAVVLGAGQGPGLTQRVRGEMGGSTAVALNESEMPSHTHVARAISSTATTGSAADASWAEPRYGRVARPAYAATPDGSTRLSPTALGPVGGSQPHENRAPSLGIVFVIALQGLFPPRP